MTMETNWISVKERLPKFGDDVLVADKEGVTLAFLTVEGEWVIEAFDLDEKVTHWMPLPPPPKTE